MQFFSLVLIAIFVSMAGCNLPRGRDSHISEFPKPEFSFITNDAEILVQYAAYLRRLNPADLNKEHELQKQNVAKSKTDLSRAQLAVIYLLPSSPLRDETKALGILESLVKEAQSQNIRSFAVLLLSLVAENRRLDDGVQALSAKVKDEQSKSAELQQKLEALKSIEKSLSERDRGKTASPLK